MYSDIHTTLRKMVNSIETDMPKYWIGEQAEASGAMMIISRELASPESLEFGSNPQQSVEGFLQIRIMIPSSNVAVNARLDQAAAGIWKQFPISDFRDGDLKVSINSVEAGSVVIDSGWTGLTVRINLSMIYC